MTRYEFKGLRNAASVCGLEIIDRGESAVVILTELADNPGSSITNMYEELATRLHRERLPHLAPEAIRWIEHYPADKMASYGRGYGETFDEVTFTGDCSDGLFAPTWRQLDEHEVEGLKASLRKVAA